jgi:hypothetical protein
MEKEVYLNNLKEIELDCETKMTNLYREYALSNGKFKIGDIIKDDRWAFTIDKITVYKRHDLPVAAYHGFELKKDLTPKKNGKRVSIYGNDAELLSEI